jgi:hypothetical protein
MKRFNAFEPPAAGADTPAYAPDDNQASRQPENRQDDTALAMATDPRNQAMPYNPSGPTTDQDARTCALQFAAREPKKEYRQQSKVFDPFCYPSILTP